MSTSESAQTLHLPSSCGIFASICPQNLKPRRPPPRNTAWFTAYCRSGSHMCPRTGNHWRSPWCSSQITRSQQIKSVVSVLSTQNRCLQIFVSCWKNSDHTSEKIGLNTRLVMKRGWETCHGRLGLKKVRGGLERMRAYSASFFAEYGITTMDDMLAASCSKHGKGAAA